MKKERVKTSERSIPKAEYEVLAQFRYQLRRFLRFSELTGKCERCLEQLARLHRAGHLSLRGKFSLPDFDAAGPQ